MRRKRAGQMVWILALCLLASAPAWANGVQSSAEAQALAQALLAGRTSPLQVGDVREVGQAYEVEVVTPKGSLVDRWLVDKASGRMQSLYGRMLLSFTPAPGSNTLSPGWGVGTRVPTPGGIGADPGLP